MHYKTILLVATFALCGACTGPNSAPPEAPKAPEAPKTPEAAKAPEAPKTPEAQAAPDKQETTNVTDLSPPKDAKTTPTHVLSADAQYYGDGPQQGRPPDGTIKAGTRVALGENIGSYVRVTTEDNVSGFVSTEVLQKIGE